MSKDPKTQAPKSAQVRRMFCDCSKPAVVCKGKDWLCARCAGLETAPAQRRARAVFAGGRR